MSHYATNWAIQQRGLKPATKLVLWYLCDRHNPDYGCFPSQKQLAADAEMSRASVNTHLKALEDAGLIRRIVSVDEKTRRQRPTRYILRFEAEFHQEPCPESGHGISGTGEEHSAEPCPESGHGAVSRFCAEPCPENGESRVQNLDTNPVREPLREPVKEEEGAQAREFEFEEFFAELLSALGFEQGRRLPSWWRGPSARAHVLRWQTGLGLSWPRILEVATATRADHPAPPDGPAALDRAMERAAAADVSAAKGSPRRRGRAGDVKPAAHPDAVLTFLADWVNGEKHLPPTAISALRRDELIARGLVTEERLRHRGIR